MSHALDAASAVVGWGYFFAWSFSFYPQLILNFRRQNVEGLSFDFAYLNLLGFLCYTTYTVWLYCDTCPIEYNDIAFAVHAVVLCAVLIVQAHFYPRGKNPGLHSSVVLIIAVMIFSIVLTLTLTLGGVDLPSVSLGEKDVGRYSWFINWIGYVKVVISCIKFIPQCVYNYRRKSTVGFSLRMVLLDLTGGTLSFTQQFIDSARKGSWAPLTDNPVKLGLGVQSIVFDIFFLWQNWYYMRHRPLKHVLGIEEVTSSHVSDKSSGPQVEPETRIAKRPDIEAPLLDPSSAQPSS